MFNFDRRPDDFEEPVGTPGALRSIGISFAPGRQVRLVLLRLNHLNKEDLNEMRQIDDDEFNPKVIEAYERGSTLGKSVS